MNSKYIPVIISLLILPIVGFSQVNSKDGNTSSAMGIGFDVGITSFYGDIDEGPAQGDIMNNLAFRASVCKGFGSWFILEGQLLVGNLSGEKKRGQGEIINYQYFKTEFIEYSLNADINLISLLSKNHTPKFNVCVDVGAGVFTFKSKLYDGNDDSVIESNGYDGKSSAEVVFPFGIKVGYNISNHFYVLAQTSSRMVNSDMLDSDPGNNNRDYYNYTSVGLIYKIPLTSSSKSSYRGYGHYSNKTKRKKSNPACATFN